MKRKFKWMKKMFPKHKAKIMSGGNYKTALDVAVKLYDGRIFPSYNGRRI